MARPPKISVIVNFFNMQREARRTLHSLTREYQRNAGEVEYEVVAIDNASTEPLDPSWVRNLGEGFKYTYYESGSPSPCKAINHCARKAKTDYVMICIDGARILSPGILQYTWRALKLHSNPFVYTLGMHLGDKPQNHAIEEGYDQEAEDQILNDLDWEKDGYRLFEVSSVALSSKNGFFSELSESNCFTMRRGDFLAHGGLNEKFTGSGGGLANLDFFNIVHDADSIAPIMLLGEATFHQFHGGVATNVPPREHPWAEMAKEYKRIRGSEYRQTYRRPEYYGWLSSKYHARLMSLES